MVINGIDTFHLPYCVYVLTLISIGGTVMSLGAKPIDTSYQIKRKRHSVKKSLSVTNSQICDQKRRRIFSQGSRKAFSSPMRRNYAQRPGHGKHSHERSRETFPQSCI